MNIDTALKLENQALGEAYASDTPGVYQATQLAFEALKAIKCGPEGLRTGFFTPLQGETKE